MCSTLDILYSEASLHTCCKILSQEMMEFVMGILLWALIFIIKRIMRLAGVYLLKIYNRNIRKRYEICSKFNQRQHHWLLFDVFIVNFEPVNVTWEIFKHNFNSYNKLNNNQVLFATKPLCLPYGRHYESKKRETSSLKSSLLFKKKYKLHG